MFEKIYSVVSGIPKGKVMTYGQVAHLAAIKNPRVVGFAMRTNKDITRVPCHRVVGKNGELTGYARGGVNSKRDILKKEGVKFTENLRVDLQSSLYTI